ncbi:MAG: short-chain dehydrogenase [Bacteroidetes bacterium]|nr:MAG: short-chain dehydrogenase [Bacteroidota bacterium]
MGKLKGKIIVVTGGSGLLGKSFLKKIIEEEGVAVNIDYGEEAGFESDFFRTDITNENEVLKVLDLIIKKHGRIDGLVNNAYPRTKDWGNKFEDIKLASWKQNVDMQLNSYFYISQKVLEYMKLNTVHGSIVNIASIYGVVANDFTIYEGTKINPAAAYSAIKGGLINFTKYLASYYGQHNIRINCVSPGGIFDNQPVSFVKNYEKKVPLKRLGTPDDISPSVTFLLSDEAKYVTGHNLIVDGGWTIV